MVDTRGWDDTTYAAYMRGRRREPDPLPMTREQALISLGRAVERIGGAILNALGVALHDADDISLFGKERSPFDGFQITRELKFMVNDQQVTIPENSFIPYP